jgi:hypothetical protein
VGTLPEPSKFDGGCQPPSVIYTPALTSCVPCYRSGV